MFWIQIYVFFQSSETKLTITVLFNHLWFGRNKSSIHWVWRQNIQARRDFIARIWSMQALICNPVCIQMYNTFIISLLHPCSQGKEKEEDSLLSNVR